MTDSHYHVSGIRIKMWQMQRFDLNLTKVSLPFLSFFLRLYWWTGFCVSHCNLVSFHHRSVSSLIVYLLIAEADNGSALIHLKLRLIKTLREKTWLIIQTTVCMAPASFPAALLLIWRTGRQWGDINLWRCSEGKGHVPPWAGFLVDPLLSISCVLDMLDTSSPHQTFLTLSPAQGWCSSSTFNVLLQCALLISSEVKGHRRSCGGVPVDQKLSGTRLWGIVRANQIQIHLHLCSVKSKWSRISSSAWSSGLMFIHKQIWWCIRFDGECNSLCHSCLQLDVLSWSVVWGIWIMFQEQSRRIQDWMPKLRCLLCEFCR